MKIWVNAESLDNACNQSSPDAYFLLLLVSHGIFRFLMETSVRIVSDQTRDLSE
ncbi:hypothetical protein [Pontibacter sp. G13]|uniref:hypothetical protein n=1 Tax=Pontibacter sp. G13 TaxID=3074898 RepID=UPI00288BCADD|nr:hypothetical protein [Pontibacter sp. G13]WNJ20537.1 hypothetical protein RJD25_08645 [Pontibacter sp. G13]